MGLNNLFSFNVKNTVFNLNLIIELNNTLKILHEMKLMIILKVKILQFQEVTVEHIYSLHFNIDLLLF